MKRLAGGGRFGLEKQRPTGQRKAGLAGSILAICLSPHGCHDGMEMEVGPERRDKDDLFSSLMPGWLVMWGRRASLGR